jgi:hypothetical protein
MHFRFFSLLAAVLVFGVSCAGGAGGKGAPIPYYVFEKGTSWVWKGELSLKASGNLLGIKIEENPVIKFRLRMTCQAIEADAYLLDVLLEEHSFSGARAQVTQGLSGVLAQLARGGSLRITHSGRAQAWATAGSPWRVFEPDVARLFSACFLPDLGAAEEPSGNLSLVVQDMRLLFSLDGSRSLSGNGFRFRRVAKLADARGGATRGEMQLAQHVENGRLVSVSLSGNLQLRIPLKQGIFRTEVPVAVVVEGEMRQ